MVEPTILLKRKFVRPNEINRYLYCPICIDVFNNPMRLFCGHTFCEKCLFEWGKTYPTCPECRETIEENLIGKDLTADNLIQDLEVYCPNRFCDWKQDLRNMPLHFQNCQYKGLEEFSSFEGESYYENDNHAEESLKEVVEGLKRQSSMEDSNLKTKPLDQYHDLLHCIEEYVNEEHLLNQKQNYFSNVFSPYQTSKVICKENLKTERKKKRRHKGGEFDRGTEHILKKSKLMN